jgi:hypothetical protein
MVLRDLTVVDLEYVLWFGRRYYCAGVLHVFMGSRDFPAQDKRIPGLARLEGTTIVLDPEDGETVITVYRNRKASGKIRRKAKINLHKSSRQMPLAV